MHCVFGELISEEDEGLSGESVGATQVSVLEGRALQVGELDVMQRLVQKEDHLLLWHLVVQNHNAQIGSPVIRVEQFLREIAQILAICLPAYEDMLRVGTALVALTGIGRLEIH